MNPGGGGYSEPKLHHCPSAWMTGQSKTLSQNKQTKSTYLQTASKSLISSRHLNIALRKSCLPLNLGTLINYSSIFVAWFLLKSATFKSRYASRALSRLFMYVNPYYKDLLILKINSCNCCNTCNHDRKLDFYISKNQLLYDYKQYRKGNMNIY